MNNKIGISSFKVFDIERKIVNVKLNLIDEYFTFNQEKLDFEYLKKLNNFLFSDIYNEENLGTRKITESDLNLIDMHLEKIVNLCINESEKTDQILQLIQKIWYFQPFCLGNTRTLIAYLKVLNNAFILGLDINVNQEIVSKPSMFNIKKDVNQKRLTKIK